MREAQLSLEGGGASTPDNLLTIQSMFAHLRLSHVGELMMASNEGANPQRQMWTCNTQTNGAHFTVLSHLHAGMKGHVK